MYSFVKIKNTYVSILIFLLSVNAVFSQSVVLKTPRGTSVMGDIISSEFSPAEIAYLDSFFKAGFPGATFVSSCSKKYNCHEYAWHPATICWINDPSPNWTDCSYLEVDEANAQKIVYAPGLHSAVQLGGGTYISKWGQGPVMKHTKYNVPPSYGTTLKFYKLNDLSVAITNKTDEKCKGPDGSATASGSGGTPPYTYTWSNGAVGATVSLKAGTYSVTVKDKYNYCDTTIQVVIDKEKCPPPPPPPPPPFTIPVTAGGDPNDITGPAGYGEPKWVSVNDVLPYTIRFENDPKIATAAVNKVVVTHPIDNAANMFSFRLGNIRFRNFVVDVPPNTSHFFKRLNLVDSMGVYLDITAGLDVTKKQAFWIFQAYDSLTGLPNTNPDLGFLLINDSITHNGEGAVSFSVKPKITSATGDSIKAYADIVFDVNASIRTNIAFNTIDAYSPASKIKSVTPIDAQNVQLSWNAHDDAGGCGIEKYKLLISTNNDPYVTYADSIIDTSIVLHVMTGNRYKLQTIAVDNVSNMEKIKAEPDTIVEINPPHFFITPNAASKSCAGGQLTIRWNNIRDVSSIYLQASTDSGKTYATIGPSVLTADTIFNWNIPATFPGNKYYVIRAVNSANQLSFAVSDYFYIKNKITVNAGEDKKICPGDSTLIGGIPTASDGVAPYIYKWNPSQGLSCDTIGNPYVFQERDYVVHVTDLSGCSNNDTVRVITYEVPFAFMDGLDSTYYNNSVKDTLQGFPEGGTFSGVGIIGNLFDPSIAGLGTHTITYTYINEYGCMASTKHKTIVLSSGNVMIIGLDSVYCINASPAVLTGIPSDGIFSGAGMTDNIFNPSIAGVGTHEIKYTYTDSIGTSVEVVAKTTVYALPLASFTGLSLKYCINSDTVELIGNPTGGIFTGDGISGNKFIVASAGLGSHQITYSYKDGRGCSGYQMQSVIINSLPLVSFSGLNMQYCVNSNPVELTGTPAGGAFSGDGISDNNFNPSVAGIGVHQITYSYADSNGCSNSHVQTVIVNDLPVVSFSGLNLQYCINSNVVELTGVPSGGTFTGDGISGNSFNPSTAGAGVHEIIYSYTDSSGCSNNHTQSVTVNDLPVVSFSGLNAQYCIDTIPLALTATSAGRTFTIGGMSDSVVLIGVPGSGTFTGDGISGNIFSPSIAGLGVHHITYSYADQNGCSNSQTQQVTVNDLPVVNFSGLNSQYCINSNVVELTGVPSGGTFTGDGISGNSFNPPAAGVGVHEIIYSYTDSNGCSNNHTQSVIVNNLPVVGFSGLDSKYCINADTIELIGNPTGGIFTGDGISGNKFIVTSAGLGSHQITYSYTDGNNCSAYQTQSVVINSLPLVSFSGLNPNYCINAGPVELTPISIGGTFTGDGISGNIFSPSIAGLGVHQITYSYTDPNGCSNSQTQIVTVNDLPVVNFSGLNSQYCINTNAVVLTGTPIGGIFSGDGMSGNNFNPSIAGVGVHQIAYSYTDSNGCSNSQTQTVTIYPIPTISIIPANPSVCTGSSITLTANGASSYVWNTGATTASINISPSLTTTYIVIGTNSNGCTNTQVRIVTVNPAPTITITPVNPLICNGSSIKLTVSGAGNGGSYKWNTGATTTAITVSPVANTTYTVVGTNANGCTNIRSTVVTINPTIVINPASSTICNGSLITLTASGAGNGGSYKWSTGAKSTSIIVSPSSTITYTVVGTNNNGCKNFQSTIVTVNPKPSISITPVGPAICNGSSVTLTANGASSYVWNAGTTTASIFVSPSITTTYSVTGTNGNGCKNYRSTVVTVNPNPTITITPGNPFICNGSSVKLTAHGVGGNYKWSTGAITKSITVSPSVTTTYTVTGTNTNGCTSIQSTVVTITPTIVIDPVSATICSGRSVTLTANGAGIGGSYKWNTGAKAKSIIVAPPSTTTYTVTGTNISGCKNYATSSITVNNCHSIAKEIKDTSAQYFYINPNPATDNITIGLHLIKESYGRIEMLDMLGRKVKEIKQGVLTNEEIEVNIKDLSDGVYYIQVIVDADILIKKLIIN